MGSPSAVPALFIGGMGRSGSTLISRILGAVPGYFAAGELHFLWDQGVLRNRLCGCGQPFRDCPFWTAVGDAGFSGWDSVDGERARVLRRAVARTRSVPLLVRPSLSSSFQADLAEYTALVSRLYRGIHEVTGGDIVVDTSKYPAAAYVLRDVPGVDLRVLHLIRSSYGVCYSWTKSVERPDREDKLLPRFPPSRTAAEWTAYNALYDGLGALGVPTRRFRYEDFLADPPGELRRMLAFTGRVPADADLQFVRGNEVELPSDHSVAGNPMRFRSGAERLVVDDAWRTALPRTDRAVVGALTAPGLLRYGYGLSSRR